MSWSKEYKTSIDCDNPHGFSQKAHCAARKKRAKGEKTQSKSPFNEMVEHCGCTDNAVKELEQKLRKTNDTSYDSIDGLMQGIMKKHDLTAKELHNAFVKKHNKTPDDWIKDLKEGTLHQWFKGSKSKDGKPGWVQADGSPCANEPGETKTPKCFSSGRLRRLKKSKKGRGIIKSAVRRKRSHDKGQQQKSGASSPTYVPTFAKGKRDPLYVKAEPGIKESMEILEGQKDIPGKGSGKKDACYYKVKSRFSIWPSAYGSASLVRCRKVGAKNWGKSSSKKSVHKEETMHEEQRYCPLCDKREKRSECSFGEQAWDKVSIKDHEYSMARSELDTIVRAAKRVQKKVAKGEGNLEAWVQSKITRAADYIDTVADYIDSGEMNEAWKMPEKIDLGSHRDAQRQAKIRKVVERPGTPGEGSAAKSKLKSNVSLPNLNQQESLTSKISSEIINEKCWPGYKQKRGTKKFEKGSCVKAESVTIEDANGNPFVEVVDLIKPEPIKGFKSQLKEAKRLQAQTGNILAIILMWRGKSYAVRMFFPQVKLPTRQEVTDEIQKVYPGATVIKHVVSEFTPGQPLIQAGMMGGNGGKLGPDKNYVKPMGEEVEIEESKKSEMPCNKPKSEAHGSGETGKSHVVKACEGGKEKLIRFGQLGVKGSPKKKGESKAYANRRKRFKARHARNIAKGKMSAAYWADKVKW